MNWLKGESGRYIHTEDGRFYICRSSIPNSRVYTLTDGNELVCTERGEGALERLKEKADELANGVKSYV